MKADVNRHDSSQQPEELIKAGEGTEILYDLHEVNMPFQSRHGKLQCVSQALKVVQR
jgi:hypothetical protein